MVHARPGGCLTVPVREDTEAVVIRAARETGFPSFGDLCIKPGAVCSVLASESAGAEGTRGLVSQVLWRRTME